MNSEILLFFEQKPEALPLYEVFEEKVLSQVQQVRIQVKKTQISFSNQYMFACVSFLPVRKAKERPKNYIVITFSLPYEVKDSRIDAATEPYPGRFTHHVLVSHTEELNEELMGWVKEAAVFSAEKQRRR